MINVFDKSAGGFNAAARARRYSRRKKPWRAANRCREAVRKTNRVMRRCLLAAAFAEALVITGLGTGILPGGGGLEHMPGTEGKRDSMINITRETKAWSEEGLSQEAESGSLAVQPHEYPDERTDSGVTIDWKKGRLEFWRSNQKMRQADPEEGEP